MLPELTRHRGPYIFLIDRPHAKKVGFWVSEWLKAPIDGCDVEEEAQMLLTDPRDTIHTVAVFSLTEQAFVTLIKRGQAV